MKVTEMIPEFVTELFIQLTGDDEKHGTTWLNRPLGKTKEYEHQAERIFSRIQEYYDDWRYGDTPMPWLKVAGLCVIGWSRDKYPQYFPDFNPDIEMTETMAEE